MKNVVDPIEPLDDRWQMNLTFFKVLNNNILTFINKVEAAAESFVKRALRGATQLFLC